MLSGPVTLPFRFSHSWYCIFKFFSREWLFFSVIFWQFVELDTNLFFICWSELIFPTHRGICDWVLSDSTQPALLRHDISFTLSFLLSDSSIFVSMSSPNVFSRFCRRCWLSYSISFFLLWLGSLVCCIIVLSSRRALLLIELEPFRSFFIHFLSDTTSLIVS